MFDFSSKLCHLSIEIVVYTYRESMLMCMYFMFNGKIQTVFCL